MIRWPTSPWAAYLVEKDGLARMSLDFQVLNSRLMVNSGGLGDDTIIHGVIEAADGFSTSIDLASDFHRILFAEKDKYKTAFRDAHGELCELNRWGFGLKTLPAAFPARVGAALGALKVKGVQNCWMI